MENIMEYMQEAYEILIKKLKEELIRSNRNTAEEHDARLDQTDILINFIHEQFGKDAALKAAKLIDIHEAGRKNNPNYNYGMVDVVTERFED